MFHLQVSSTIAGKVAALFGGSFFLAVIVATEQTNVYIPFWIALTGIIPLTVVPLGINWFQQRGKRLLAEAEAKLRRAEKEQDWQRQDEVAARVIADNKRTAAHVAETARLLLESNETVEKHAAERGKQLAELSSGQKVIKSLVDGQMTAAIQSELDTKEMLLIALKELAELKGGASKEAAAAIRAMQTSIDDLKGKLESRRATEAKLER